MYNNINSVLYVRTTTSELAIHISCDVIFTSTHLIVIVYLH